MDEMPDEKLMQQCKHGDAEAFKYLYLKYRKRIYSYIFHMGPSSAQSEELTQETFLRAFSARDSYMPTAKFSTWLWTIAKHLVFDALQKKSATHEITLVSDEDDPIDFRDEAHPMPDMLLEGKMSVQNIRNLLTHFDEPSQEIFLLRIFSDLEFSEISKVTSMPLPTVKTKFFRMLKKMREIIEAKPIETEVNAI